VRFPDRLKETLRDQTRDRVCAHLLSKYRSNRCHSSSSKGLLVDYRFPLPSLTFNSSSVFAFRTDYVQLHHELSHCLSAPFPPGHPVVS